MRIRFYETISPKSSHSGNINKTWSHYTRKRVMKKLYFYVAVFHLNCVNRVSGSEKFVIYRIQTIYYRHWNGTSYSDSVLNYFCKYYTSILSKYLDLFQIFCLRIWRNMLYQVTRIYNFHQDTWINYCKSH